MSIVENRGRVYAGAATRIIPPVTAQDCANTPAFEGLCLHESKPGRGVTIRAGKAWARRTPGEIAAMCSLGVPWIVAVSPSEGVSPRSLYVGGAYYGEEEWKVFVSRSPTWVGAGDKQLQEVVWWSATAVEIILDVHCQGMGQWYVYVENSAQRVNALGKSVTVTACS